MLFNCSLIIFTIVLQQISHIIFDLFMQIQSVWNNLDVNGCLFNVFRRRCSTSRDVLEVRRSLSKNRPGISVTEAICVTKHKSAKLYFKTYKEASLSVDCRTSLEENRHF